ncbi:putative malic acid transport protein [Phaeomoniella chlamydospora]|uniref:Putative malic acid transport protein n=1 Tax=Phaeomoniella chlamydospora TaxID=158046 RepID=A0A0G2G4Q9_PHACM|nr:putative malic acid transport protein [Phaeomoniella chlamydospora]
MDHEHQMSHWSPAETARNSMELEEFDKSENEKKYQMSGSRSHFDVEVTPISAEPSIHKVEVTGDRPWRRTPITLRERLRYFTWAWYTLTMSTGGLALLIFAQPFQFPGLRGIGMAVYVINLILFAAVTSCMLLRFFLHRGTFAASLTHEREGFFFPTFWLSIATLITSTQRYVIPDNDTNLLWAIQLAYWAYALMTFLLAIGQYSFVFAAHSFGLQTMMPTWILPIFPIMLTGTIASVIAETQPDISAIPIVISGLACQGLGLSVSFMMYAHMVGRLMQSGLPNREHRPGLFMCVGPPAFTALALIGMANGLPDDFDFDTNGTIDVAFIRAMAIIIAGFLWALSLWWFFIAVIAVIASPPQYFHLGWWAMVFPNTGFTLATITLANEFESEGVKIFATVMSVGILIAYSFVIQAHVRAVLTKDILFPGRDEDVNDH